MKYVFQKMLFDLLNFLEKNVSKIIQIIQNKGFSIYHHEPLTIFDTVVQG